VGKYSDTLMDHVTAPRNSGVIECPHVTGLAGTPGNGPFMVVYLKIEGWRVRAAKYQT
jgi:NifU-like protein involved in Fe-S cluster formation